MKIKVKHTVETTKEIELPTFHTTFFRKQFFDGEKLHSISHDGRYTWLESKPEDILSVNDRVNESDKQSFIDAVDKAIERLNEIKQKAEQFND